MTEMLVLEDAAPGVAGADNRATVRGLVDELLAAHADAGDCVAALVDGDAAEWEAARPWVARLVADGREFARRLARLDGKAGPDDPPLEANDAVPPVVWAREVGAVQRCLRRVVRDLADVAAAGEHAAALRDAVDRTKRVGAALSAAALGG